MLKSKEELTKDQSEMRKDFSKIQSEFQQAQKSLVAVVDDTKFWLDKFMKSFADQEASLQKTKVEISGEVTAIKFQLTRKLSIEDMRVNYKALTDLLFVKFTQVEEMKQGLRDMLVYQKYYFPLEMQVFFSKYMENFSVANQDAAFVTFQKQLYTQLLEKI